MRKFIKLTSFDDSPVIVNVDEVYEFETVTRSGKSFVQICFVQRDSVLVKENCDLIYKMIHS